MSDESSVPEHEPLEPKVEVLREAVTMALYISLSLIAVLLAVPSSEASNDSTLGFVVGVTAIGLVLAHQVAFRMSTRLVSHGRIGAMDSRLLQAQLAGGLVASVVAVVPLLFFSSNDLTASVVALLLFVCLVGYLAARSVPVSRLRALVYVVRRGNRDRRGPRHQIARRPLGGPAHAQGSHQRRRAHDRRALHRRSDHGQEVQQVLGAPPPRRHHRDRGRHR